MVTENSYFFIIVSDEKMANGRGEWRKKRKTAIIKLLPPNAYHALNYSG